MNSQGMIQNFDHNMEIRGLTPESRSSYARILGNFASFLGASNKNFLEVSKNDLRDYVEALNKRRVSTRTIGLYLATLSSFYDFLVFDEMLQANPIAAVRK